MEKIVHFNEYCYKCTLNTAKDKDGFPLDECEDCLQTPVNEDSHKPVGFKEVK